LSYGLGGYQILWANYSPITLRIPLDGGIPGELLFAAYVRSGSRNGAGAGLDQLNTPGDR